MDNCEQTGMAQVPMQQMPMQLPDMLALSHLKPHQVQSVSPIAMAYIGDAVFELYIRLQFLWPPQRIQAFHQQVVSQVKAEQQADFLDQLMPHLDEAETDIVRRGRNATSKAPRRLSAKIYRQATAFEALVGYLYITNQDRLFELLPRLTISPSIQS